ncbi:hypothetical protein HMPREF0578_1757 [Mobiluncus mulieris 28-1]|nr:hypothetical protein HMPREF0578_1757 [Mobiluncus mulieris 28-1]
MLSGFLGVSPRLQNFEDETGDAKPRLASPNLRPEPKQAPHEAEPMGLDASCGRLDGNG